MIKLVEKRGFFVLLLFEFKINLKMVFGKLGINLEIEASLEKKLGLRGLKQNFWKL